MKLDRFLVLLLTLLLAFNAALTQEDDDDSDDDDDDNDESSDAAPDADDSEDDDSEADDDEPAEGSPNEPHDGEPPADDEPASEPADESDPEPAKPQVEAPAPAPAPPAVITVQGKPVTQSSDAYNGPAHLAIDGNTNQRYFSGSCTHTNHQIRPWWQVDLGRRHQIVSVQVWNRVDCCGERLTHLKVQVSDDNHHFRDVGKLNGPSRNGGVYVIPTNGAGRFVRLTIDKDQPEYLTLCEVRITGFPIGGQGGHGHVHVHGHGHHGHGHGNRHHGHRQHFHLNLKIRPRLRGRFGLGK